MSSGIGWGLIGAGRVARSFAEGLRSVPDSRLVAVTSRSAETLRAFQAVHHAARAYPDVDQMLDDEEVDVVYVATPHHCHADDTISCIRRGRPVLCEKPFTVRSEQARQVVAEARDAGVFCMEAMWTRWIPAIRRTRALVASGAIGEVVMITCDFSAPTEFDPTSRFWDSAQGGGALLDRGIYGISFASMLLGPPERVRSSARIGCTGVDESVEVALEYPSALAVVTASLRGAGSNDAVVMGSEGSIRVHAPFFAASRITLLRNRSHRFMPLGAVRGPASAAFERSRAVARRLRPYLEPLLSVAAGDVVTIEGNGYNYEALEVHRCVRTGLLESPDMPLDETIAVMETVDAARRSWLPTGTEVDMSQSRSDRG